MSADSSERRPAPSGLRCATSRSNCPTCSATERRLAARGVHDHAPHGTVPAPARARTGPAGPQSPADWPFVPILGALLVLILVFVLVFVVLVVLVVGDLHH